MIKSIAINIIKDLLGVVFAIIIILMILTLSGCAEPLKEGEVYRKQFVAAHTDHVYMPIVHTVGKLTYTQLVPIDDDYPDEWIIFIRQYNEDNDSFITQKVYVTEEVYNSIDKNDYYVFDEKTASLYEPDPE